MYNLLVQFRRKYNLFVLFDIVTIIYVITKPMRGENYEFDKKIEFCILKTFKINIQ